MALTTQTSNGSWYGVKLPDNVANFYERVDYDTDQNVAHWTTKQGSRHIMPYNKTFGSINAVLVAMKLS